MNKKKTVWIFNEYASTPNTGMAGRSYYLARELAKQGYCVYLIATTPHHLLHTQPKLNGPYTFESVEGFTMVWVKVSSYSHAHSKQRVLNWFLFSWKIQKLRELIPDLPETVLISSPALPAYLGVERLSKKLKAKLVFEVRDIWPLSLIEIGGYSPKHPFIRFMQWIEDRAYQNADKVVSNLKNSIEHMVSRGMKPEKFTWVANGFSLDEVNQKIPLDEGIKQQLPKRKFIVGYTGTLGVANTLDVFLEVAEALKEKEKIAFVLVGSGKEKTKLEVISKKKNLTNVTFIDPIPKVQIQAMLSQFDACFIGLSKDPLFRFGVSPNKLFDYLYSAKPILYAIDSGSYKPVEAAAAGIQVEPENIQALKNSILKLYDMPEEQLRKIGENGRKAALKEYEYGMLAHKLAKVIFEE